MSGNIGVVIVMLIAIVCSPAVLVFAIFQIRKNSRLSRVKRIFGISLLGLLMVPLLIVIALLLWITVLNFPFTSGVIAHTTIPTGEDVCVVQICDVFEYSVGLYAQRHGQPWVSHYLANDDDRWRNCRLEVSGDGLHVYTGSTLRKTFPLAELTASKNGSRQFPAEYKPGGSIRTIEVLANRRGQLS